MNEENNLVDSTKRDHSESGEIHILDLIQTLVVNFRILFYGTISISLIAVVISFLITPTYIAKTQFLPPQQQQSSASALLQGLGAVGGLAAAATGLKNPADQYIAFMKTQSIQDAMIERYKLQERYSEKYKVDARKELTERTKISAGKDGIIQLEVEDKDPVYAAELANGYVQELKGLITRLSLTEAQQRRQFFGIKLNEAKTELAVADKVLRSTGINASTLKSSPLAAVEIVAKLKGAITAQEVKIGGLRGYLSGDSPELNQALIELTTLRNQLAKAEKDDPLSNNDRVEESYVERYREYKYKETLFEMFAKQYELARIDEAREGAIIQVIDIALPPEKKSKPRRTIIVILSALISVITIMIYVFVRETIRKSKKNEETSKKIKEINEKWKEIFKI